MPPSPSSWSISIKTVGGRRYHHRRSSAATAATSHASDTYPAKGDDDGTTSESSNFTIDINPDDPLSSLHASIMDMTGLDIDEMRLIYRGRIIDHPIHDHDEDDDDDDDDDVDDGGMGGDGDDENGGGGGRRRLRVRDVCGLSDGQTIHLVPRRRVVTHPAAAVAPDRAGVDDGGSGGASFVASSAGDVGAGGHRRVRSTMPSYNSYTSMFERLLMASSVSNAVSDAIATTTATTSNDNTTVASLSGEAGLALLAALLGAASSSPSSPTSIATTTSPSMAPDATVPSSPSATTATASPAAIWGRERRGEMGMMGAPLLVGGNDNATSIASGGRMGSGMGIGIASGLNAMMEARSAGGRSSSSGVGDGITTASRPIWGRVVEEDVGDDDDDDDDIDEYGHDDDDDDEDPFAIAARRRRRRLLFRRGSDPPPPASASDVVTATAPPLSSPPPPPPPPPPRHAHAAASSGAASARATARARAARLTEADVRLPDPGGIEHVRQGMMTLHTMLGGEEEQEYDEDDEDDEEGRRGHGVEDVDDDDKSRHEWRRLLSRRGSSRSSDGVVLPRRKWYKGQWLDALDTVHQWLEATIVDVVHPSDVLSGYYHEYDREEKGKGTRGKDGEDHDDGDHDGVRGRTDDGRTPNDVCGRRRRRRRRKTKCVSRPDAVVSANDLEGRRRLLLEPIPPRDDDNDNDEDGDDDNDDDRLRLSRDDDEGCRYRPRPDNDGVQLLLIHYNGWPHRWDEWIRGDSERIRPFRTRTRHRINAGPPSLSSSSMSASSEWGGGNRLACPTPQAAFGASPSTAIRDEEDVPSERAAMLAELAKIMRGVNELLQVSAASVSGDSAAHRGPPSISNGVDGDRTCARSVSSQLPWRSVPSLPTPSRTLSVANPRQDVMAVRYEDAHGAAHSVPPGTASRSSNSSFAMPTLDAARLRQLAPLLDRLGRTLTDAAPHVAALAESLPSSTMPYHPHSDSNVTSNSHGEATHGDADAAVTAPTDPIQSLTARASRLYFGIVDDDNEEESNDPAGNRLATAVPASPSSTAPIANILEIIPEETMPRIDPDLTDYVNGMVNTTRWGGGGGGFGSGRNSNRDHGLDSLASYLTSIGESMSIGGGILDGENGGNNVRDNPRVIRMGGGMGGNGGIGALGVGGPGIDIHIHAIVTGPGMEGIGGLGGFAMESAEGVGSGAPAIHTPRNNDRPFFGLASTPGNNNHDDDDADLFSELYSESPDPVNMHGEEDTLININGMNANDIDRLLDECRGLDDYDSEDCRESENENEANMRASKSNPSDSVSDQSFNTLNTNNNVNIDGSNIDESVESLSEIESQESNATVPTPSSPSSPSDITASMRIDSIGRNSTSSSLGSRLFRRTFGRLPGSSSRRSG